MNWLKTALATSMVLLGLSSTAYGTRAMAQDVLWQSYYTSAQNAYQKGEYEEAARLLNSALNAATKTDESLSTYYYLAHVYEKLNRLEDAQRYYRDVLEELGTKTWAVLRPPDGTPDWDQSAEVVEDAFNTTRFMKVINTRPEPLLSVRLAKPITIVDVLCDYGQLMQQLKQYQDAERTFRQALVLADCRPDHAVTYKVRILERLNILYDLENRGDEQKAIGQELVAARSSAFPDFDKVVAQTIHKVDKFGSNQHQLAIKFNNLALFCATHGDYARAQTLFSRALVASNNLHGRAAEDRATILRNYSDLLQVLGRSTEAVSISSKANAIANSSAPRGKNANNISNAPFNSTATTSGATTGAAIGDPATNKAGSD